MIKKMKSLLAIATSSIMLLGACFTSINSNKTKSLSASTTSDMTISVVNGSNQVIYSSNEESWDTTFSDISSKYSNSGDLNSLQCVINLTSNFTVTSLVKCSYLPMPLTINLNGNTLYLNYDKVWTLDHGLTINGNNGNVTTSVTPTNGNCSIKITAGKLIANQTNFSKFDTKAPYPLFTVENRCTLSSFTDCTFTDCRSYLLGGAIYVDQSSNVILEGCTFTNCMSVLGGAMCITNSSISTAEYFIDINTTNFVNCTASYGGALYIYKESNPELIYFVLKNTLIDNCSATINGGAIYIRWYKSVLELYKSKIQNCSAENLGGAIFCDAEWTLVYDADIASCNAVKGGGIYYNNTNGCLYFSNIHDCKAKEAGPAYFVDSSKFHFVSESENVFTNNLITNNFGGATLMSSGSLTILLGILAGVFFLIICALVYLILRQRKQLESKKK